MDPTKHVLLALTGGAVVLLTAGGNIESLSALSAKKPTDAEKGAVFAHTIAGWAALLLILGFASDIEPIAPLAVGFSWLIFLTVMLIFGERAATNALTLIGRKPTPAVVQPTTHPAKTSN